MEYDLFFGGLVFLVVGYLIYRFLLKGVKHSLETEDGSGPTLSSYVGLWGSVIICFMVGIALYLNLYLMKSNINIATFTNSKFLQQWLTVVSVNSTVIYLIWCGLKMVSIGYRI
ncbi:hypothetical protein ACVWYG_001556 [Pedobacter sp. UYEF25]